MRTLLCIIPFIFSLYGHAITVENIASSPESVRPLLPGLTAPNMSLLNKNGQTVNLASQYQAKTTILVIYRGGWCPYCSRQLAGLQKIEKSLVKLGAQIIAISPDKPEKLAQSTVESENYQLLSDQQLALTQALGLAYYLDDKTADIYRNKLGVNIVDETGAEKVALPVPAVFVVDKQGVIQFQYANPNYKTRLDESVLLAAVRAASNL
ncbi:peroxiredoxin-like family protein [Pseudoalteromonas sp. T1lg65]|uniref:peroxiredoxin-like family protein n=1 Tax=Pseudoalteromonas sp. T1lg65 TaxID=2077101 RepID=UPI003F7A9B94